MTDPDPAEPRPPTPAPGHPATLREVADRAQVHISTASRALDASQVGRISEATVARVRAAAAELRYAPDLVAAGLKRGRTATIGVVVADLANPYLGPLIRGISTVMEEQGIVPLIAETLEDEDRLERVLLGLVQRRVDAIITAATHLGDEPTLQQVSGDWPPRTSRGWATGPRRSCWGRPTSTRSCAAARASPRACVSRGCAT
jgi:LacI family transcriptional regulator